MKFKALVHFFEPYDNIQADEIFTVKKIYVREGKILAYCELQVGRIQSAVPIEFITNFCEKCD